MANTLTKEQINAINNYENDIKTLSDWVQFTRKRAGVEVGGVGARGYISMIREVFQNAIDQVMLKTSPANWIYIYFNETDKKCIVKDNGLGIPYSKQYDAVCTINTSRNYDKKPYEYGPGYNGHGLKATNALSSRMYVDTFMYDGTAMRLETIDGYPKKQKNGQWNYKIPNKNKFQGTEVTFWPCIEVLGDFNLEWKEVYKLVKQITIRSPIGTTVDFEAKDSNGVIHKEHIINKDGIITDLIDRSTNPICKPIYILKDTGFMRLEAAFVFDGGGQDGPDPNEEIIAYCNTCPTALGTHIKGTLKGITNWFIKYMNTIYLSSSQQQKNQKGKSKSLSVIASDIKTGLIISINAAMLEPVFIGQAKEQLSNEEMEPFCTDTVLEALNEWGKQNPNDLTKLCKYFKDVAELRIKQSGEKAKIVTKYTSNVISGYPANYVKPLKHKKELILVEGNSAAGTVSKGRDVNTQGLYPLRGKITNAFKKSRSALFENEEIQGIIKIITGQDVSSFNKHFDPVKDIEWEKIIIMTDADIDGGHIETLLLRFFVLYMPQLIQAGKVFKAVPPLYSLPIGKREEYFTTNLDFVRYIQKLFVKNNDFKHLDKSTVSSKEATLFFMKNEDYIYYVEKLAVTFGVNPALLEFALFEYYNKSSTNEIRKKLSKQYRFMRYEKKYNVFVYSGIIGESNDLPINDKLIKECKPILDILGKNREFFYLLNGKKSSIYEVMKAFEQLQPNHLQRYKGLGEMDADQLAESTLLPGGQTIQMMSGNNGNKKIDVTGNRTLIRYTIEDVKEEISIIRNYESDFSQLFKFVGNISRQDLLD